MAELKNESQSLISRVISRETEGETVETTIVKVPLSKELADLPVEFGYGTNKTALLQDQTNERTQITETQTHTEKSGEYFDERFGQAMLREIKVVDPTDSTQDYDGQVIANETVSLEFEPIDLGHSRRTHVKFSGSIRIRPSFEFDNEMGRMIFIFRFYTAPANYSAVLPGSSIVYESFTYPIYDVRILDYSPTLGLIEAFCVPVEEDGTIQNAFRTELQPIGYQAPAIVEIPDSAWTTGTDYTIPPPWVGTNYNITAHRTASYPAVVKISYHQGEPTDPLPTRFVVTSPGAASRIIPIPENSIHPDFTFTETTPTYPTPAVVETYAASTPAPDDYDPSMFVCVESGQRLYRGNIWVRRVAFISVETPPEDFPSDYEVVNGIVIPL